jgi:hypothetical protein
VHPAWTWLLSLLVLCTLALGAVNAYMLYEIGDYLDRW